MSETTPRRIEWAGPEGWTVWADEDGVHIKTSTGGALEMPDVERLFALWQHARSETGSGHVATPKPPTRDEIRAMSSAHAAEYARHRARRAIDAEFAAAESVPF